ncbi:unnamed protein product [Thlaspi arvense]|uniref:PPIase cyclophilin-type domain-containing protein n=1 Tax=Thlaspi arvense TaxID=13288 RepID=A0AAU9RWG5_THLAR|nr:unnamed protein product [Thlaspi arvense]
MGTTLLLVHASARNLQQTQNMPLHGATAPNEAESPTVNVPLEDRKNFIVGGAAGIGGFMGMPGGGGGTGLTLPLPSGTPLLGGSGAFGGLGGAMGFPGVGANGGGSVPSSGGGLMEVFTDESPHAETFRALCTGEEGIGKFGVPLHYKGSLIDRVVPNQIWDGGDFRFAYQCSYIPMLGNHRYSGNKPIRKHDRPGLLSMYHNGRQETINPQFNLVMAEDPDRDYECVVVGQVTSGFDLINYVKEMARKEYPYVPVTIDNCGQILPCGSVTKEKSHAFALAFFEKLDRLYLDPIKFYPTTTITS